MARLPQVGGDAGNWGALLNDFLLQSHTEEGDLKTDSVGAPQIQPASVTNAAIAFETITENKLSSAVQAKLNTTAPVTSVASKTGDVSLSKGDVGLANVDDTSDVNKPISTATQNALNAKADASTLSSALATKVNTASVGSANGVASLDGNGLLPDAQVPTRLSTNSLNSTIATQTTPTYSATSDVTGSISLASYTKSSVIQYRLTGNITITTLPPSPIIGHTLTLVLTQDATGSRTLTLPGTVKKAYGLAPTLSTSANALDMLHLFWDGVSWHVFVAGLAMS
ncbi:MAG: hypothetical protein V4611_04775 [Patescibacteria group bacterium]